MEKPDLIILCGLPGCGKSTFAKGLGVNVHSSDEIKFKLQDETGEIPDNKLVFNILHENIIADLKAGKDCVYDATNLSRSNRVKFLNRISDLKVNKVAMVFIAPIEACKERNNLRTGREVVPDHVYDKFLRTYCIPVPGEGFDEIVPVYYKEDFDRPYIPLLDREDLTSFDQKNPHHTHTLGVHLFSVADYFEKEFSKIEGSKILRDIFKKAAVYHDIGKLYTQTFDKDGVAHYYGHENYSTYLYLIELLFKQHRNKEKLNISNEDYLVGMIINCHMLPYAWEQSEKSRAKHEKIFGKDFCKMLEIFNMGDKEAH